MEWLLKNTRETLIKNVVSWNIGGTTKINHDKAISLLDRSKIRLACPDDFAI